MDVGHNDGDRDGDACLGSISVGRIEGTRSERETDSRRGLTLKTHLYPFGCVPLAVVTKGIIVWSGQGVGLCHIRNRLWLVTVLGL